MGYKPVIDCRASTTCTFVSCSFFLSFGTWKCAANVVFRNMKCVQRTSSLTIAKNCLRNPEPGRGRDRIQCFMGLKDWTRSKPFIATNVRRGTQLYLDRPDAIQGNTCEMVVGSNTACTTFSPFRVVRLHLDVAFDALCDPFETSALLKFARKITHTSQTNGFRGFKQWNDSSRRP